MNEAELLDIIARGEDSRHQFKRDFSNIDSLAAELIAFANTSGGLLLIGVSDDGHVSGLIATDVSRLNQLLSNASSQSVRPPINPSTMNIQSRRSSPCSSRDPARDPARVAAKVAARVAGRCHITHPVRQTGQQGRYFQKARAEAGFRAVE